MFKFSNENMNTYSADSNTMASFSCENCENGTSSFAHAIMACAFLFLLTAVLYGFISAAIINVIIMSVIIIAVIIRVIIKTNRICALKDTGY